MKEKLMDEPFLDLFFLEGKEPGSENRKDVRKRRWRHEEEKNEARAACPLALRLRSAPTLVPRFGLDPATQQ